jgi:menaquinone-9 beta-reductase
MNDQKNYDTAIIGGGLAGLSLAILLAKQGHSIVLFEKEQYPFHKVCGEYISMESWPFLEKLGVPFSKMNLPRINNLQVTAPDGNLLSAPLPLGGFGISRYKLDALLRDVALENKVHLLEKCKVSDIKFIGDHFVISSAAGTFTSKTCCGSFGKKSNLDVKWNRPFTRQPARRLNQYAGIKYHIETGFPADTIALHNFKNGYCGISRIEEGKYCLCYLTHNSNLGSGSTAIKDLENGLMSANPHLKNIFSNSRFLFSAPVAISQISFLQKSQVEDHVLLLGDAAGMITPLCGNGMSMAMHGALIASQQVNEFLKGNGDRASMEKNYISAWQKQFAKRLRYGRMIQYFFGKVWMTNLFIRLLKKWPMLTAWLIRQTHGKPF